ncbi:MAG: MerR family transcriptional regulator [Streptosporangiales bacterium]|nr:MerR family transcriptional regulator [Streptosporangiales bacterium]
MRIGELAALAGVSTRTVRHYHHLGLLPEPERRANGYREYRLRDAVILARVRRLAELGLSLDEIRDVLADERGRELREVLRELEADLARQQEALATRRARLAALLEQDELDADATVAPEAAAVLRDIAGGDSKFARFDRGMLSLVYSTAGPEDRERFTELLRPFAEPEAPRRGQALYARLDELADADPGDPRVPVLAKDLAEHMPDGMAELMLTGLDSPPEELGEGGRWLEELAGEMSSAQTEVFRLLVERLREGR